MTYSRDTTALSEITGQSVSTWSEEWQHECEARIVLATSKAERDAFFNGSTNEDGKRKERSIIAIRGAAASELLRSNMQKLQDGRETKK
jgi:hypothetical protein